MTGNNTAVITDADRRLFEALAEARILDREQASEVLGRRHVSIGTCNRRLLKLTRSGLLKRFFISTENGGTKALYSLTARSAALVDRENRPIPRQAGSVLTSEPFVLHQLAVNSIYVQVMYRPAPLAEIQYVRWLSFRESLSTTVPLTPDGYFELRTPAELHPMFCEVDRGTESQVIWTKKTQLYLRLAATGEFERTFKERRFRVLVISTSERRLLQIRKTVAQQTSKVFWFSTLNAINRDGLLAAHWLRPTGDERLSLL